MLAQLVVVAAASEEEVARAALANQLAPQGEGPQGSVTLPLNRLMVGEAESRTAGVAA